MESASSGNPSQPRRRRVPSIVTSPQKTVYTTTVHTMDLRRAQGLLARRKGLDQGDPPHAEAGDWLTDMLVAVRSDVVIL